MKVWVLAEYFAFEGHELVSVHATEAGARLAADAMVAERRDYDIYEMQVTP